MWLLNNTQAAAATSAFAAEEAWQAGQALTVRD
jgi:hypothetical protein